MGRQNSETALEAYIDAVVEAEKEEYRSSIKPFSVFEEEVRSKLSDSIRFFQQNYTRGYEALLEEIKRESGISKSKEDLSSFISTDPEKLKIFDDPEALMKAFEEGSSIYQLLGFSEKSLNIFYHAACQLLERKEYKKAEGAFYFLITIAPEIYLFWIALGRCCKNIGNIETSLQVFLQAISIDPTQVTAYLDVVDLFIEVHDVHKAEKFCAVCIKFASENHKEPWSAALKDALEEKKQWPL